MSQHNVKVRVQASDATALIRSFFYPWIHWELWKVVWSCWRTKCIMDKNSTRTRLLWIWAISLIIWCYHCLLFHKSTQSQEQDGKKDSGPHLYLESIIFSSSVPGIWYEGVKYPISSKQTSCLASNGGSHCGASRWKRPGLSSFTLARNIQITVQIWPHLPGISILMEMLNHGFSLSSELPNLNQHWAQGWHCGPLWLLLFSYLLTSKASQLGIKSLFHHLHSFSNYWFQLELPELLTHNNQPSQYPSLCILYCFIFIVSFCYF